MNLQDFKKKYSNIRTTNKLKEKQNENLLSILNALFDEMKPSGCTQINFESVNNENEVTIGNCDNITDGIISKYNSHYSKYGLNFKRSGSYFQLIVSPQPQTTTKTTDNKTDSNSNKTDAKDDDSFNIYRHVTKQIMGEELNEEINRIKKIIYNG
jgi:hypothetical protein